MKRKSLVETLHGNDAYFDGWDKVQAARDFELLPVGEYECLIENGELRNAATGTAGYKLTFRVLTGQYTGRRLWYDIWLTDLCKGQAKRDLDKLRCDGSKKAVATATATGYPLPCRRRRSHERRRHQIQSGQVVYGCRDRSAGD